MKPILIDSFGMLLSKFLKGEFVKDEPHFVYHFGTMKEGIFSSEHFYLKTEKNPDGKATLEQINSFLELLKIPENEGRLNWRTNLYIRDSSEKDRFKNMLNKLRELGANDIPEWDEYIHNQRNYDAYWNIPAMREFIGDRVQYMFRV